MSGLVNKVKEALHSAHDTPTAERSGKLDLSTSERERLEAAGYGSEHRAEKRHVGATEDLTQASGGHPPSHYLDQETKAATTLPGSFPGSEPEGITSQMHKDGREYVAPKGTHVRSATTGQQQVSDPSLTHPTSLGAASKVSGEPSSSGIDTQAADVSTTTGTGTAAATAGAGAIATHQTKTGPNKLHKKGDPRGHVVFSNPPTHESIHSTQAANTTQPITSTRDAETPRTSQSIPTGAEVQQSNTAQTVTSSTGFEPSTAVHHSITGTNYTPYTASNTAASTTTAPSADPTTAATTTPTTIPTAAPTAVAATTTQASGDIYEQQASRKYDGNTVEANTTETPNFSYPTGPSASTTAAPPTSTTITQTSTSFPDRGRVIDNQSAIQNQPSTATTSTDSHVPGPRHVSGTVYNTVTGAGSQDDPTLGQRNSSDLTTHSPLSPVHTQTPLSQPKPAASSVISPNGLDTSTSTSTNATSNLQTQTGSAADPHLGSGISGTGAGSALKSRVVHACTSCGADNDISHYFIKDRNTL